MDNLQEVRNICDILNDNFDSHDFIREFIYRYPSIYGGLLTKHNNVVTAHAEIANYLLNHSSELGIMKNGINKSKDVFGNDAECALWTKI
ncbi:MAG: hypothetical protein ACI4US_01925 [Muribaculaceae bacterium]